MYEAVLIAATGLTNQQRRLDVIANNVANVNSVAYKTVRLDFKDALYTAGVVPGRPRTPEPNGNQQKGHGVMVTGITKDYRTGSIQTTGRELDFAIEGEGFFEIEDIDGSILYTRNGSFHADDDGWIVTSDGYWVHDVNGQKIQAPDGTDRIIVSIDGRISFEDDGEVAGTAAFGVYTFRNLMGLESSGNGNYNESVASGEKIPATVSTGVKIHQGDLEMSNVSLAEEMTRIIRTQRAFQLASRALKTADDMEAIANNMRK